MGDGNGDGNDGGEKRAVGRRIETDGNARAISPGVDKLWSSWRRSLECRGRIAGGRWRSGLSKDKSVDKNSPND